MITTHNEVSAKIIGAAIEVHRELGPGLLERIYGTCLVHLLREMGLCVETQVSVPLVFRGIKLGKPLRLDVPVEDMVIVEIKAVGGRSRRGGQQAAIVPASERPASGAHHQLP